MEEQRLKRGVPWLSEQERCAGDPVKAAESRSKQGEGPFFISSELLLERRLVNVRLASVCTERIKIVTHGRVSIREGLKTGGMKKQITHDISRLIK